MYVYEVTMYVGIIVSVLQNEEYDFWNDILAIIMDGKQKYLQYKKWYDQEKLLQQLRKRTAMGLWQRSVCHYK